MEEHPLRVPKIVGALQSLLLGTHLRVHADSHWSPRKVVSDIEGVEIQFVGGELEAEGAEIQDVVRVEPAVEGSELQVAGVELDVEGAEIQAVVEVEPEQVGGAEFQVVGAETEVVGAAGPLEAWGRWGSVE